MPVLPSEEEAPSDIYDQVAKNPSSSSDSTASGHESHQTNKDTASAQDFTSKGPVIFSNQDDLPPKASKEELKARAEELNK